MCNLVVWNVQSINNKVSEVMEHIIDCNADFAFISETWLTSQSNNITATVKTMVT